MAGRQDKAVAVGPAGLGGVEFQEAGEQHGGDIGHAQGQAGMPGFCGFHRIHRQRPDGVGEAAGMGLIGQGHLVFPAWVVGGLSEG
jgi:hypothetical protein